MTIGFLSKMPATFCMPQGVIGTPLGTKKTQVRLRRKYSQKNKDFSDDLVAATTSNTMNDHCKTLFGRQHEIACLKEIITSALREGDYVIDQPLPQQHRCPGKEECDCTVRTEASTSSPEDDAPKQNQDESALLQHRTDDIPFSDGSCHFCLVSGPSGAGKRTLVTSVLSQFRKCKQKSPFLLVSERFHAYESPERRVTSIIGVFHEMALIITQQSFDLQFAIRKKLLALLKNPEDASALSELIPCVKKWLQQGESDAPCTDDSIPCLESEHLHRSLTDLKSFSILPLVPGIQLTLQQTQFWFPVLQKFLLAVMSCVPVVVLLEDLQYADESSLLLIRALFETNNASTENPQDEALKGLLLLATYSDIDGVLSSTSLLCSLENSVDGNPSPFAARNELSDTCIPTEPGSGPKYVRSHCCKIHQIVLSDLSWDDVSEWVDACGGAIEQCSSAQKNDLTKLVFHHSTGNPSHIRYLLLYLEQDESLLLEPILKKRIPGKIDDLFVSIFARQEESIQKVVQILALLAQYSEGDVYHDILEIAFNAPCFDIVETAHRFGLIEFSTTRSSLYFRQESLRNAVSDTIVDVSSLCRDIGRRIWSSAILYQGTKGRSEEVVITRVFLSTQILRNSIDLLTDIDERIYMSQLCYETGQKSSSLGDFRSSSKLFEFAIHILSSELWRPDLYEASLILHNAAAQAFCSIADYINMNKTLDVIFDNAASFRDKLPAYLILVYASGSQHQLLETFRVSSMVLQELGEPLIENPNSVTIITYLLRVKWILRCKTDQFLSNFPLAENEDFLVATRLLSFTMFICYMNYPNHSILLVCRLILSALKHGICGPSSVAFSCYSFILCSTGEFHEGYRMGQLALHFADKFQDWRPRVHVLVYGYVNHWTSPFRNSLDHLKQAQRASLLCGDLEIYAATASFYLMTALSAGVSFTVLEPTARSFCSDLFSAGQKNQLLLVLPLWSFINDLQGGKNKLGLNGDIKDANSALNHCIKEGNKYMIGNFYSYRTMWCFLIGEYEEAMQVAKIASDCRPISDYTLTFYKGLASVAKAWTSTSWLDRRRYLGIGKKSAKCVNRWADRCPENFRNKQWLLQAEIAAIKGESLQALSLFQQSIGKAKHEGFVLEEAVAYERLGHYQRRLGNVPDTRLGFSSARSAYEKCGASFLVDRMTELLAFMT